MKRPPKSMPMKVPRMPKGPKMSMMSAMPMSHLPKGVAQSPQGDLGAHRAAEARVLGTFKGGKDYTSPFKAGKVRQTHEPFYSR